MNFTPKDIEKYFHKISKNLNKLEYRKLFIIKEKLISLYRKGYVKLNHTIMELLVSRYLIKKGYDVDVELKVNEILVCDVYGEKENTNIIVEVETGFVPPSHSLDPLLYRLAREVSKIARYSLYAKEFALATPNHHIIQVPKIILLDPKERQSKLKEIMCLKRILDKYYKNPPISFETLMKCKLDKILVVNVDDAHVTEYNPFDYYELRISDLILYESTADLSIKSVIFD